MSDASTEALKSISTLLQNDSTFFIPSYQRGYRWKIEQVTQLLDDIKEFADNLIDKKLEEKPDENYYCLQPLVVKKRENTDDGKGDWEVIDGQQRITTTYLILHYLYHKNKLSTEFQDLFKKFKIRYETRENQKHNSHEFLKDISKSEKRQVNENTNVDFLFISKAYEAIEKWFADKSINCDILLKDVKFIWHNIGDEDSREVFTRINTGKIPLSNAELIKALFLQRKNFAGYEQTIQRKQLEIAMEWDKIEFTLKNNEFWYFLNTEKCQSPTRIEFIFDLIAEKKDSKDKDHSFKHFYKKLKNEKGEDLHKAITEQWEKVRNYYLTLLDWYNDGNL